MGTWRVTSTTFLRNWTKKAMSGEVRNRVVGVDAARLGRGNGRTSASSGRMSPRGSSGPGVVRDHGRTRRWAPAEGWVNQGCRIRPQGVAIIVEMRPLACLGRRLPGRNAVRLAGHRAPAVSIIMAGMPTCALKPCRRPGWMERPESMERWNLARSIISGRPVCICEDVGPEAGLRAGRPRPSASGVSRRPRPRSLRIP
jgi:hypothetical protein